MPDSEKLETQIFSKILRHIAERIDEIDSGQTPPDDMAQIKKLLTDIADAFEKNGGFEYTAEQALPLAQTFATITANMRTLSYQATDLGSEDAAGKIKWAAAKAHRITADLEEHHLGGAGGIVTLEPIEEESQWDDEHAGHT